MLGSLSSTGGKPKNAARALRVLSENALPDVPYIYADPLTPNKPLQCTQCKALKKSCQLIGQSTSPIRPSPPSPPHFATALRTPHAPSRSAQRSEMGLESLGMTLLVKDVSRRKAVFQPPKVLNVTWDRSRTGSDGSGRVVERPRLMRFGELVVCGFRSS